MIRFTTKTDAAPTEDAAPKKQAKVVTEAVQLSLDPDAPEDDASAKPAKKRSSFRGK